MDKKTIILVAILAIVIMAYFPALKYLGVIEDPPPTPVVTQTDIDSTGNSDSAVQTIPQGQPIADAVPSVKIEESAAVAPVMQVADSVAAIDTITVVTQRFTVKLSTFGGGPVSLELNKYYYRDGRPIQMLPESKLACPEVSFANGSFSTSRVHYKSSLLPGEYDATTSPLEMEFTLVNETGGTITKRYIFYPDRFVYDLVFEVNQTATFGFERQYSLIWNTPLGVTEPDPNTDYEAMEGVAMTLSGSRESMNDFEDDKMNQLLAGDMSWAGVRNKYFTGVIIPRNRTASSAIATGKIEKLSTAEGTFEAKSIEAGIRMDFANAPVIADSFSVFVGPMDYTLMSRYDIGLEDMLDIGTMPFVGWIIKPFAIGIIWLLPKMYSVIPNYGFVIIIFALLIKLITMPLSMKSFKSMNAMKEIQPQLDELKKKHKNNPQALNSDMMKLYKKHGVSPVSGCLPMLPQMPLFIAMFSVFRATILLRDAPFIWFIDDLSRGATSFTDPYIILVLIMIGAQFFSAKFTMPSTGQNKALTYVMPLFMGFLFYKFPSGLVLYWICFSLFSMIDYFAFKRKNIKNPQVQTA